MTATAVPPAPSTSTPEPRSGELPSLQVTVPSDVLREALLFVGPSISYRAPVPVLAGVLLEASASGLTVTGWDYELLHRQVVPVAGGRGRALVPYRQLLEMVRAIGRSTDVRFDPHPDGRLRVRGGDVDYRVPVLPLGDYPALPDLAAGEPLAWFEPADLVGLRDVIPAAGKDETLPILTAVRMRADGDGGVLAEACDRYRLAELTLPTAATVGTPGATWSHLVRAKTLARVVQAMRGSDVHVRTTAMSHLTRDRDGLVFEAGHRTIATLLVDGEYPHVQGLWPPGADVKSATGRAALVRAVKQVSAVLDKFTPVSLAFDVTGIHLAGGFEDGPTSAYATRDVAAIHEGPQHATAFTPSYLLEALTAVGGDNVALSFAGKSKPAVLTSPERPTYRHLLMPVRMPHAEEVSR